MTYRVLSRTRALMVGVAVMLFFLGGCASTGDPRDPFEPMNRAVYRFNDGFDNLVARPTAEFYQAVVPQVVRTGVGNFFSNINDVLVALNNVLQGKVPQAINDMGRVLVNTTLGVFGVMDPATELGVEKNNEDFGQTLGWWGLPDGPYLVLPFLGPSSVRDTVGWAGDIYAWPVTYVSPDSDRNALVGLRFISTRTDLLDATRVLETAALDPYEFVRDAYLQRRRNLVHDGNPPPEDFDFDDKPKPKPGARRGKTPGPAAALGNSAEPVSGVGNWRSDLTDLTGVEPRAAERPRAPQPAQAAPPAPERKDRVTRIWLFSR